LKLFKKFEVKFKKACGETLKNTKIKDVLDDDLVQIFRHINIEPPHGDEDYDGDKGTSSRATSLAPTSTSRAGSVASTRGGKDADGEEEEGEQDAEEGEE